MYFPTVGGSRGCHSDSEAGVATHAFRRPAAGFVGDLRVGGCSVDSQPTGLLFTRGDPLQVKASWRCGGTSPRLVVAVAVVTIRKLGCQPGFRIVAVGFVGDLLVSGRSVGVTPYWTSVCLW